MTGNIYINNLNSETSPYLLQHAHNPVNWYPWGKIALNKAVTNDKPLIISIGYAACHWCHVMEKESFIDEEVAAAMNGNFICIKVDREERPDIDQLYMDAIHLMNGAGGWPLNIFALPDGKPFFGGTYFSKTHWISLCNEIASMYRNQKEDLTNYAEKLTNGIISINLIENKSEKDEIASADIDNIFENIYVQMDTGNGGMKTDNKFLMPDVLSFLLQFGSLTKNKKSIDQLVLTLDKIAKGGIFDQLGGGFARYSTDIFWKIPHFEKMLYDNAQMTGLYAEAFQFTGNPLFREIVYKTFDFIKSELTSADGGFYSSIDADSEGEEGKFYLWTEDEIKKICGEHAAVVMDYFGIYKNNNDDNNLNVLFVNDTIAVISDKYQINEAVVSDIIEDAKSRMYSYRKKRVKPATDDKILTCWNALMADNLVKAYKVFHDNKFLEAAEKNIAFIETNLFKENNLFRSFRNGIATIPAFLDDYSFLIRALAGLYDITFDYGYLKSAKELAKNVIGKFYDDKSGFFFFTGKKAASLISVKIETSDNVIPSSNSVMAENLFLLGKLFSDDKYLDMSRIMLIKMLENITGYPSYYSNWAKLLLKFRLPFYDVAITGKDATVKRMMLESAFLPNKIVAGSASAGSEMLLLKNRFVKDKTLYYVCVNNTCRLPVEEAGNAIAIIKGEIEELTIDNLQFTIYN